MSPISKEQVLSSMRFGQRVAEEESDELTAYFVETDDWRRVFSGEVDIVYGAKGSGKSAIYALLLARRDRLFDRSIILAPAENPRGTTVFSNLVADPPASEREFIGLWKLYFTSLVFGVLEDYDVKNQETIMLRDSLEQSGLVSKNRDLRTILKAVGDYVRASIRPIASLEGGVNIDLATSLPKGFSGKITFEEPSAPAAASGIRSVDTLLKLANDALKKSNICVWILLDRLDVAFADTPILEQNALRAIFKVYLDMLSYSNISAKVFLRTDIWRKITAEGFREASHIIRTLTLAWDRRNLLKLVVSRAIQNPDVQEYYTISPDNVLVSTESQHSFFYRMFPDKVDVGRNPETFDWILGRTSDGTGSTAPREVIHLLNALREAQVRRVEARESLPEGELLFVRPVFKEALSEVSKVRLEQTLFAEYPSLRKWLDLLHSQKTLQDLSTLAKIWKVDIQEAAILAQELVEIGFFELQGTRAAPQYWVPFLYRDALNMVQGTAKV